jgi:hypothetical protein
MLKVHRKALYVKPFGGLKARMEALFEGIGAFFDGFKGFLFDWRAYQGF